MPKAQNATPQERWLHRIAFSAIIYFDIETTSSETSDEELERLAIQALRQASPDVGLPLEETGLHLSALRNGRIVAEPSIDEGLENFVIDDCYQLPGKATT